MRECRQVEGIFVVDDCLEQSEEKWSNLARSLPDSIRRTIERQTRPEKRHIRILLYHALYQVASAELNLPMESLEIMEDRNGKPYFAGYRDVCFNLSHSSPKAAIAISPREIGIDIEKERTINPTAIAEDFFHKREIGHLKNCPDISRQWEFFRLWTLKESYLKAIGTGLSDSLSSFSVVDESGICPGTIEDKNTEWSFCHLQLPCGYHLSVCRDSATDPYRFYSLMKPKPLMHPDSRTVEFCCNRILFTSTERK